MICRVYCLVGSLLLANPAGAEDFFRLQPAFDTALRAQSPDAGPVPAPLSPPPASPYNPFAPPSAPSLQDPFLAPPQTFQPAPPPILGPLYGVNGPQPYRFGWTPKLNLAYLPSSHTEPSVGNFSAFELDSELVYNAPFGPDLIFTAAPQFSYHQWDVTSSSSRDLYRFGLNLQLATPVSDGALGYQVTFNPSVNTDFQSELASESLNWDANAVLFYQVDPSLMAVLGVGYLDRVDNIVLPYAGVVWRPNELWELRLLFPQGRISRYIGEFWWGSHWLYLAWEYHVEAYQVSTPGDSRNKVQMEDYRLTFGMRSDHPGFTKFIEAGYVFGRNVDYQSTLPGFDISDGFIIRGGIRF